MKKLVFILSLFLSIAALCGNNGEGGPIPLKYQSVDGIIYDQYGNRYVLEGTFKYTNVHGNIIEKDCAGTEFIAEPGYDWGENWHKYASGSIAGHKCKKVPVDDIVEVEVAGGHAPLSSEARPGCDLVGFDIVEN